MSNLFANDPLWYKSAVFYEVYVRAFFDSNGDGHGDLAGMAQKLDYLQELGVNCLWLLPIYPSPLKDDGYDIANYYEVYPGYGSIEDFEALVDAAHARGMRVITDLVLNHTSDQHPWFQAARSDPNSPYHDYYVWSDTSERYPGARIIFLDTESSNWTYDEVAGKYYWHRFYSSQPDLNYDNPAVQEEMRNVMRFWLELGVDGFRADAVPYLFERDGTNCENLPETHAYLKGLRRFINEEFPDRVLLAEANQWPEDVLPYFGEGDEFHMGFHFPVMPRIFMALRQGTRTPLRWILERTPPLTESCQWVIFLRNHDELTLEMVTEEERQWMWDEYAPDPRMRLNLGIRRRLAPLMDNDRRKIELANSMLFTLPGSPIIYYGDEIGMGDNIWLPDRNGVRTPMQWNAGKNAGFSTADPDALYAPVIEGEPFGPECVNVSKQLADPNSLLYSIRKMVKVRNEYRAFGWGGFEWVDPHEWIAGQAEPGEINPQVAAYARTHREATIIAVHNLTGERQPVLIPLPPDCTAAWDLFTGVEFTASESGFLAIELEPYQYVWLKLYG